MFKQVKFNNLSQEEVDKLSTVVNFSELNDNIKEHTTVIFKENPATGRRVSIGVISIINDRKVRFYLYHDLILDKLNKLIEESMILYKVIQIVSYPYSEVYNTAKNNNFKVVDLFNNGDVLMEYSIRRVVNEIKFNRLTQQLGPLI